MWEKITTDQWVISVIREGYKLEFEKIPAFMGVRHTVVPQKDIPIISKEISSLIEKDAVEMVPLNQQNQGFYSTLFLVPKKNGELRPVINLRPLNRYLVKKHFKMDTLSKIINLVKPNDWAFSIDLSDAYMHIPIFPKHRKYLRFAFQGKCYQWKVMCFGPTVAPRVFTKIVSVVAAHLRTQNIRLAVYLDDWLCLNQIHQHLLKDQYVCLNLLIKLGFLVNLEKSNLIPQQIITYIGAVFNLKLGLILPTEERFLKIQNAILDLVNGKNKAQNFLHLLGLMASCLELIPNARLFMRPIQLHLLSFWKPSSHSLDMIIPFTQHLQSHLRWWLNPANIFKGRSLHQTLSEVIITTDASKKMYGGHLGNQYFQGTWSLDQINWHINSLEMEAVFLTVSHFLSQIQGKSVLIKTDNTTVVQYINKQGGTKSSKLCIQTWKLWTLAIQNNISLRAVHIVGTQNILADQLSRHKIRATEWSLNPFVVQKIFQLWGTPLIDLFASVDNHQTPIFCSWFPTNRAFAIDALSISWENMYAYAYPPLCLIPRILTYIQQFHCQIILIAPQWQRRHWYPEILNLLVACPLRLPVIPDLLVQPKTLIKHPNPEIFHLTAWLLSTDNTKRLDFLKTLENCSKQPGDQVLKGTMVASSEYSIAGVVQGKLIPILHL